jgi:hypothetical protein
MLMPYRLSTISPTERRKLIEKKHVALARLSRLRSLAKRKGR